MHSGSVPASPTSASCFARLAHPGIARLLDAGISAQQNAAQPYLVLEYVDGRALLEHVRERASTVADQVRLTGSTATA